MKVSRPPSNYNEFRQSRVTCMEANSHIILVNLVYRLFPIWYTWYTWFIISHVTFTFWKTWYDDYKCMIPGLLHEKLSLKIFLASSLLPCHITEFRRYWSVRFAQSKVLLFWSCLNFLDAQYLFISIQVAHFLLSL